MNDQQTARSGLVLARNIVAAVGGLLLVLGLVLQASDGSWRAPMWIGGACLVVAAGFALATTRWRALPTGTKVVIVVALAGLFVIAVDLMS